MFVLVVIAFIVTTEMAGDRIDTLAEGLLEDLLVVAVFIFIVVEGTACGAVFQTSPDPDCLGSHYIVIIIIVIIIIVIYHF